MAADDATTGDGGGHHEGGRPPRPSAANSRFCDGVSVGTGPLPHRDPVAAAAFAIAEFDTTSVPILDAGRSAGLGQAAAAIAGVTCRDGRLHVDPTDAEHHEVRVDVSDDSYAGMHALLQLAGSIGLDGTPVVWHTAGPVTLGAALVAAGLDTATAFALASAVVRAQLVDVAATISAVLPASELLAMLEEPVLADLMSPGFPIVPDAAADLMSTAMATLADQAIVGIHCDQPCDLATMLASGPAVISLPVDAGAVEWAGYIERFLDDGGVLAWGVVPYDGPVGFTADRYWRALSDLWCELVRRGCDPVALRRQCMVTPGAHLDRHSASVARRIARLTADVGRRVTDQANATRFALGA